jgi:glucose uptake protein GlcU
MKGTFFTVGVLFLVAMVVVLLSARNDRVATEYLAEISGALWAIAAMLAFRNSKGRE